MVQNGTKWVALLLCRRMVLEVIPSWNSPCLSKWAKTRGLNVSVTVHAYCVTSNYTLYIYSFLNHTLNEIGIVWLQTDHSYIWLSRSSFDLSLHNTMFQNSAGLLKLWRPLLCFLVQSYMSWSPNHEVLIPIFYGSHLDIIHHRPFC